MDLAAAKKRKADENGAFDALSAAPSKLLPSDARRILDPLSKDQLLDILQEATVRHPDVLDAVRSLTDGDLTQRKLFIRGLGWDTTTEGLRSLFSTYGELQEAIVICDKATGKSKGYGFISFMHIDGAVLALKEQSKMIDGRMTVTQLASGGPAAGPTVQPQPPLDVSQRKIYVGSVPYDMPADRLLHHFLSYGEVEEGPLGFDKQTGKSKGYALFVYKTPEGARASLVDPIKTIDGHQMACKFAIDGKRGKPGMPALPGPDGAVQGQPQMGTGVDGAGNGLGMGGAPQSSIPGAMSGPFGGAGGLSSFAGFSGSGLSGSGLQGPGGLGHSMPSSLGIGNPGLSSVGGQVGAGSFGSSLGGMYGGASQFGGPGGVSQFGGPGGASQFGGPGGASQFGGPGGAGGYGSLGVGPSPYQLPPSSTGMPSGGYPEPGHYGLSASAYQSQHHQSTGSSPGARVPPRGGMFQGPPYY